MKKYIFTPILIIILFSSIHCKAQSNENTVLIEINGDKTTVEEFINIYDKNNKQYSVVEPASIEEYLDLYVNFRLKVNEAKALGYDTLYSFQEELKGYREQLARPYLTDTAKKNQLIREAYERMQYAPRISHIALLLPETNSPDDTLEVYEKMMELRDRALSGEDFGKLAKEYSDDPSARDREATSTRPAQKGNMGDMGYFATFTRFYAFESAAYNTEVGEISMPIRLPYGYHLIKVHHIKPALKKVKLAHIVIANSFVDSEEKQEEAKNKIEMIHQKLLDGESFEELAQEYSQDQVSAPRGGQLASIETHRLMPKLVEKIHELGETDKFSEPVKTNIGWHIIKLIDADSVKSFEEEYDNIKELLERDPRRHLITKSKANKLKEEFDFTEYDEPLNLFYEIINKEVFTGKWKVPEETEMSEVLFEISGNANTQRDFAEYIIKNQRRGNPIPVYSFVEKMYDSFVNETIIEYKNSILEEKHPEFREVLKEYHNGILLFEITNDMVWTKAQSDTTGLKEFYQNNLDNYMDEEKVEATIYTSPNRFSAWRVRRMLQKSESNPDIHDKIAEERNATFEKGNFYKQDNIVLEEIEWSEGISKLVPVNDSVKTVHIHSVVEPEPLPFDNIRGLVVADYQNHLEETWISSLRDKYDIKINEEALKEIKNQ